MTNVFVLCNQHNEFLNKSSEWIDAGDSKTLFRTTHRDEAINQKVELTVKQPDLRVKIVEVVQNANGRLSLGDEDCLPKTQSASPTNELQLETAACHDDPSRAASNSDDSETREACF